MSEELLDLGALLIWDFEQNNAQPVLHNRSTSLAVYLAKSRPVMKQSQQKHMHTFFALLWRWNNAAAGAGPIHPRCAGVSDPSKLLEIVTPNSTLAQ